MDTNKILFFMIVSVFILFSISIIGMSAQTFANYQTDTTNQCSIPTVSLFISADPSSIAFNTTTLYAPKNTCVAISFSNPSGIAHSFTINADITNNVAQFNIYQDGTTTNATTLNFITPNEDISIKYFCAVPGHVDIGMRGNLVVGSGSSVSPVNEGWLPFNISPRIIIIIIIFFLVSVPLGLGYFSLPRLNENNNIKSRKVGSKNLEICISCYSPVSKGDVFCQNCGTKL